MRLHSLCVNGYGSLPREAVEGLDFQLRIERRVSTFTRVVWDGWQPTMFEFHTNSPFGLRIPGNLFEISYNPPSRLRIPAVLFEISYRIPLRTPNSGRFVRNFIQNPPPDSEFRPFCSKFHTKSPSRLRIPAVLFEISYKIPLRTPNSGRFVRNFIQNPPPDSEFRPFCAKFHTNSPIGLRIPAGLFEISYKFAQAN